MKIYCNFMDGKDFEKVLFPEFENKPVTIFIDCPPKSLEQLKENPINILTILEPNQLFGLHDWAIANKHNFSCILSWGDRILKECDNSLFFPFGVSWLDNDYINNVDNIEKKFEVSFLCGAKKMIEGHYLRHRLYDRGNEITIPKQWHFTLSDYSLKDGNHIVATSKNNIIGEEKRKLWNSMYSICIENSSNSGYHTEKIIDAFLSKTIPIYWGCPNLQELEYNPEGYIYCKNEDDIISVVNKLTPEYYNSKKDAINHNFEVANYYKNIFVRFKSTIKEILDANNI